MIFADLQLARRIEAAEAANASGCTAIHPEAATLDVAGGCAVFVGAESPLSHAVGIGLEGPVPESELDRLEAFFRSRGAKVSIELCPLADPRMLETLGKRGYCITEFNNVLVKRLAGTTVVLTPRVRLALADETDKWSHTVGMGFFEARRTDHRRDGCWPRHLRHARRDVLSWRPPRPGSWPAAQPRRFTEVWRPCLRTAPSRATGAPVCTAN